MPGQASTILRQIDIAFNAGTVVALTDRQLVERFAARRDPIAEVAFAALVRRHGAMVLRVCRGILGDHHDAQDAFQATFLILARKAGSLWVADSLGPWLHGVACRVASTSKAAAARRRAHESKVARLAATFIDEERSDDLSAILHEEVDRLPDRYRAAVVLCDLEGRTYEEAARELGRPVGTIKSRLARGRECLRIRMVRRGVVPPAVALAVASSRSAVSAATIDTISRRATRLVAGHVAKEVIPSALVALTEGVLKTMVLSKLKLATAVLLVACGICAAAAPYIGLIPTEAGQAKPSQRNRVAPTNQTPVPTSSPVSSPAPPDELGSPAAKPWESVVRIRIVREKTTGFASGAVIHSTPAESLILTSAHQFKTDKQVTPREIPYRIKVDLFDGKLQGSSPAQVHYLETLDGELVDCDFERDISLVRLRPSRRLPASRVVPRRWAPHLRMKMLTLGCSEGQDATSWNTTITNTRFVGLAGNPAYEAIECQTAPKQGRMGGGLFTSDGYLAGVCNFSEPEGDHGLYAVPDSIYRFLDRNNLTFLYAAPMVTEKQLDDLLRAADQQLKKDDWDGADRTIQRLNALIHERRQELQDALRSLDAVYARRRVELVRRAYQRRPETQQEAIPEESIPDPELKLGPDETE